MTTILTLRQQEIVQLLSCGMKNAQIATQLVVTEHIVKNDIRRIYDKLGFNNRTEVAMWAMKNGFCE